MSKHNAPEPEEPGGFAAWLRAWAVAVVRSKPKGRHRAPGFRDRWSWDVKSG